MTMGAGTGASVPGKIYRVSEINSEVQSLLETEYPGVSVTGEISGWTRAASGHCYFELKDDRAALRCVLFRSHGARLSFEPADGIDAIATGQLTLYAARGQYQLRAERLVPSGVGQLQKAFEALKARLQAEGLFAEARKRELPRFPRVVGLVTSPTGAAVRDIIRILHARWPMVEILLLPVRVQGEGAAEEIAAGIGAHSRCGRADVLIVGRGGGSIEDLWAFNEETVVRAIAASRIPVISAVGHESDVTLSDLVADRRAATPSQAAELAVRDQREIRRMLRDLDLRLVRGALNGLSTRRRELRQIVKSHGLNRPRSIVEGAMQRLDEIAHRWRVAYRRLAADRRGRVRELAGKLEALDPTKVLARGYALCATEAGRLVRDGAALSTGEKVTLRFARGGARCRVDESWPAGQPAERMDR